MRVVSVRVVPAPGAVSRTSWGMRRATRAPGPQFSFTSVRMMALEAAVRVRTMSVVVVCVAQLFAGSG